jgi:hypothetical protein
VGHAPARKARQKQQKKMHTWTMRATNATSVLGSVFGFAAVLAMVATLVDE